MEEKFNVKNSYDHSGKNWQNIRTDLYYELEVATKVSFDQRQVLQIRAALKDCQAKLEAIITSGGVYVTIPGKQKVLDKLMALIKEVAQSGL